MFAGERGYTVFTLSIHYILVSEQGVTDKWPRWLSWMCHPTGDQEVAASTPAKIGNIVGKIDHEIFSTVILSLPLIQEGQLSVSGKRMCTILVIHLED